MVKSINSEKKGPPGVGVYLFANIVFIIFITLIAGLNNVNFTSSAVFYLICLFGLCSLPLVISKKLNGEYIILNIFTMLYFLFYGAGDLLAILFHNGEITWARSILSKTELAALAGIAMYILGYVATISYYKKKIKAQRDWKRGFIIKLGLVCWTAGLIATWIWQFKYSDVRANGQIGGNFVVVFILLRMIQPLGTSMLIYAYLIKSSKTMLLLILAIISVEFVFGFIADSKELSIRAFVVLLAFYVLLFGKIPKVWLITAICVFGMSFSIFQAYRQAIFHDRDQNRQESLSNLSNNLKKAINTKSEDGRFKSSVEGFVGRMNLKGNLHTIVTRTGYDVSYQKGYTIGLLFHAFIPRVIWPNKPDSSVGQLFNREFEISEDPNTYISATHLGELYWNFGWPGLFIGMACIGALMGFLSKKWDASRIPNITSAMLIFSTLYLLCFRFEGGIALQYTLWIRSILLILIMSYAVKVMGFTKPRPLMNTIGKNKT